MVRARFLLFFALCASLATPPSFAAEQDSEPLKEGPLTVQWASELKSAAPGAEFKGGFLFRLEKGWHIYWKNPGDSGQTPKQSWDLPTGIQVGDIEWPVPKKIVSGPLVDFGYDDEVLLALPLKVASDAKAGQALSFKAHLKWLVCKNICLPGRATLGISLPIGESLRDERWKGLFEAAPGMLPKPLPSDWTIEGEPSKTGFTLRLNTGHAVQGLYFFPSEPGQIDYAAPEDFAPAQGEKAASLKLKRSDQLMSPLPSLAGLLLVTDSLSTQAYETRIPMGGFQEGMSPKNLIEMILLAVLGGMILNLMPCVFPVLSIKVMSWFKSAGKPHSHLKEHAWFYTLGVMVSFWGLALALLGLRYGGQQIGWGFQLQSPRFVIALTSLLFWFGLNLIGVFEIGGAAMGFGQGLARKEGYLGSFFTGVLATVMATPCTAPFMGTAVGFALTRPPVDAFLIFSGLGAGLALPYLALAHLPQLSSMLPKPGVWMEIFKQLMAFPIFATVIWLCWVLSHQTGEGLLIWLLVDFFFIGLAAWILRRGPGKLAATLLALLFVCVGVGLAWRNIPSAPRPQSTGALAAQGDLPWERYSSERLKSLRDSGHFPIFVDFTAAWCISCKVNELLVFTSPEVQKELKEKNVALLQADWTNQDPEITHALAAFGRSGVPFYVIYDKNGPHPLPEVINAGIVLKALGSL